MPVRGSRPRLNEGLKTVAENQIYRLITRPDFDGIVAAVLLRELGIIDLKDVIFAEPGEMQKGNIPVTSNDITTNLPYVEGVHLCFDHHASELTRVGAHDNLIIDADAPSAAHVVYEYYGGKEKFPNVSTEMLAAVDQADSADYTEEDILAPSGWTLLNFLVDPRTGFDRMENLTVSQDDFMRDLIVYCQNPNIDEILELEDVRERLEAYIANHEFAERQVLRCSTVQGNLVITDLRKEDEFIPCNRFLAYGLYPDANISLTVQNMPDGTVEFALGKSIIKRTSKTNVGELMLKYGGGGHRTAGTCRSKPEDADRVLKEIVEAVSADG